MSAGAKRDGGTAGIHHVTAICGDGGRTVEFYVDVLGLRMLKKTVNFDDPGTYHLYFGDRVGHPGTTLTFFAWGDLPDGRPGVGQTVRVGFQVPAGSLEAWRERLAEMDVQHDEEIRRFGRPTLPLRDPDGLGLALVERDPVDAERQWREGPVPEEMAIAGFHGVSLLESVDEPTAAVLSDVLGLVEGRTEDGRTEYVPAPEDASAGNASAAEPAATESPITSGSPAVGESSPATAGVGQSVVELVRAPSASPGRVARGSVHHVAFRAADAEHQQALRNRVEQEGLNPTPVIDRYYFESVYFHEPGGVLFEIATDGPGFTRDQDPEELGRGLTLPPWLEPRRDAIEARLEPIER